MSPSAIPPAIPAIPVVAVDGPAGSGKSTVARALARALGLDVLDTGAMYRALTFAVLRAGVDPADADAVTALARSVDIEVGDRVLVDGVDATEAVRGTEVTAAVSVVSAHPGVRTELVARQRDWVEAHGGAVAEGRDIGTVVFPDAPVKVFLVADPGVRAARRRDDELAAARRTGVEAVQAALLHRDHLDSTRSVGPLHPAEDAVVIDTSVLDVEAVVGKILDRVRAAGFPGAEQ